MARIGVEVGGTFTDLVEIGPAGVRIAKTPSTPANPDEGAFAVLLENGTPIDAIDDLSHGSTVATNAVLERKGFRIAFVTTAGWSERSLFTPKVTVWMSLDDRLSKVTVSPGRAESVLGKYDARTKFSAPSVDGPSTMTV